MCVCACVRACVRACARARICLRECLHAYVCVAGVIVNCFVLMLNAVNRVLYNSFFLFFTFVVIQVDLAPNTACIFCCM